ncbi:MAG: hypothetical protein WC451_01565 [Patescibacteria group bacterium]
MSTNKVLFENNSELKRYLLQLLGKGTKKGIIVDAQTKQPALSLNGEEVKIKDFAGIRKGSEIIIKSDIGSLIEYTKKFRLGK